MKINRLFIFTFLLSAFVVGQVSFAQSDYEKTQNFKTRYKQLEDAIKNAASIDECNVIGENIAKLKSDFSADQSLLDKSLYPETFESSFNKINRALEVRRGDFTQIVQLKTQVDTLQDKVSELSQQNEGLIVQIKQLQIKSNQDAQTIASLQKLVAQLKSNIAQRDELVRGLVDSLLAEFIKTPGTLNDVEKQTIFNKVDSGNLFYNVERTISDNIQFMKVTQTTPDDLSNMKKQYTDFNKVWRQIGPKLADVYLNRRDKATEIASIDNMFAEWNAKINDEIWGRINHQFREKQLPLLPFKSGEQFVNSVSSFVDDEIKNLPVKGTAQAEKTFYMFTDSVYFKTVQTTWIPILIENNMMSLANKDTIEKRISTWKEKVAPASKRNWVYFVGGFVIIALFVAYFVKGRKKKTVVTDGQF